MRLEDRSDWQNILAQVTNNWNSRTHKSIGNLRPKDLTSRTKAVAIDRKIAPKLEPSPYDWERNRKEYEKHGKIKLGSWVYIPIVVTRGPKSRGLKSYDEQVSKALFVGLRNILSETHIKRFFGFANIYKQLASQPKWFQFAIRVALVVMEPAQFTLMLGI